MDPRTWPGTATFDVAIRAGDGGLVPRLFEVVGLTDVVILNHASTNEQRKKGQYDYDPRIPTNFVP